MRAIVQDLRFTLRSWRRNPCFALAAVTTLALGIGASTTIYSLLHAVVLRSLPFPRPDELVRVWQTTPKGEPFSVSLPDFRDVRRSTTSFAAVAALRDREVALLGRGAPQRLTALAVTPGYFRLLGVSAALGRTFLPDEASIGSVVLSHRLWRQLGGDAAILGRQLDLDHQPFTVAGVLPAGLETPGDPDLWLPLRDDATADRGDHELAVVARLRRGVTPAAASAELRALAAALGGEHPQTNGGWGFRLTPLREWLVPATDRQMLWVSMAGVALLLLLACASVANLLLARGERRTGEMALRLALGAGRGRVARQLLTESLLLAMAGAALGALLAAWGVPALRHLLPHAVARAGAARLDFPVLAFSAAVAIVAGLAFGFVPALRSGRVAPHHAGGRVAGRRSRLQGALVVAQLAIATLLLIGAGLLATSFVRLQSVDLGLDSAHLLRVPLSFPVERYSDTDVARLVDAIEQRVAALPGVRAVGATNVAPLSGGGTVVDLAVEGRPSGPGETTFARWRVVTSGFFAAAGVHLRRGRTLRPADYAPGAAPVIVVTATLARRLFGDADPLGRRVAMGVHGDNWRRIVGVVDDVQDVDLAEPPQPLFFFPEPGWPAMTLLVRADGEASALAPSLRRAIGAVVPDLPVPEVEPMATAIGRQRQAPRFDLLLMAVFAAFALLLAAIGVYGVLAQLVAARRREIGVRLAVGAAPGGIFRQVAARGMALVASGLALGLAAAAGLARLLRALLYHTSPGEPIAYAAVVLLLTLIAALAVAGPARRAASVDPAVALRAD